jgi:hypothetical protein
MTTVIVPNGPDVVNLQPTVYSDNWHQAAS